MTATPAKTSRRSRSSLSPSNPRKKEFAKDLKFKDDSKKKSTKDKAPKKDEKEDEKSETTTLSEKTEDMSVQQDQPSEPTKPQQKELLVQPKAPKPVESAPDWILSKEEKKRQRELKKKQEVGVDLPLSHFYDRKRGIERLVNGSEEDNLNRKIENL